MNQMMKRSLIYRRALTIGLITFALVLGIQNLNGQTYCIQEGGSDQIAGEKDGYRYELWNQNAVGTACMTLGSGATFSGEWDGIHNYLARRGLGYDQTQFHEDYGTFYTTFDCDYNPTTESGNSYLSVYGWTVEPLVEYYIVEDWRNWIPSMAESAEHKGTLTVNGGTYDIIENIRVEQPSIIGTATFKQIFSIRRDTRNSGTINISDHFEEWETQGVELGKMYEVSFVVEGYMSKGDFDFSELDVFVNKDQLSETEASNSEKNPLIYPNPNTGDVSIEFKDAILNASIKIYNALGKMVYSMENHNEQKLQVANLRKGMYFVHVNNNKLNSVNKILVQ